MHIEFVRTTNVRNYLGAYDRLEERGAPEACWLAVSGNPGLGKTKMLQWHATQLNAPYIRAKANLTVKWLLEEIATEYGLDPSGSIKTIFAEVMARMAMAGKPIFVDEARNLLHDAKLLETLRDLTDMTECPLVLGGEDTVLRRLTTRYPQIRRRISETVEFTPLALDDIALIFAKCCEVKATDQVIAEAYRQCSGFTSEAKNAVAAVERLARLQDIDTVEIQHVRGKRLCQDRNEVRARATV